MLFPLSAGPQFARAFRAPPCLPAAAARSFDRITRSLPDNIPVDRFSRYEQPRRSDRSRPPMAGEDQTPNSRTRMTNPGKPFLNSLETILGDRGQDTIYPCIRDLVEHGLDLARFTAGEVTPQRQDITQYLAAWSRHAGLSEEESSGWLMDYCIALLASLSRRTLERPSGTARRATSDTSTNPPFRFSAGAPRTVSGRSAAATVPSMPTCKPSSLPKPKKRCIQGPWHARSPL